VIVVVAVALVAGIAGGVWWWQSGGDTPTASQSDLPTNPNLKKLAFPDPDGFGFSDGAGEMCVNVNKTMRERGYQPVDAKGSDGTSASCWYITTGLSLLEDGSNNLNADISVWRGDAESRYQTMLDKAVRERDKQQQDDDFRASKVEQFPAGDMGFISHQEYVVPDSERADTTAVFRSGDDLMMIALWGDIKHYTESGDHGENEPLTEEITYGEITDIMTALSGEGEPGEPRITDPKLQENPALAGLTAPELPTEGTPEEACGTLTDVAAQLGTKPKNTSRTDAVDAAGFACSFEPVDEPDERPDDYSEREISIRWATYEPAEAFRASEVMGRELLGVRDTSGTTDKTPQSPLYDLPVGDVGYALYRVPGYSYVSAAYLVDGRTYVFVEIGGWRSGDSGVEPLPEDVLLKDVGTFLTGAAG
jgi:hypothetical protein